MKRYCKEDFLRVRDFLVESYAYYNRPYNWTIERWNFSISLARVMNGVSMEKYESQIGIWEDDSGKILAVVNAEGEGDGEGFFQIAQKDIPKEIMNEMFSFCEANLGKEFKDKKVIFLHIPWGNTSFEELADAREFQRLEHIEQVSELSLDQSFEVKLPEGFSFKYGNDVTHLEKGTAHAKAFGYYNEKLYRNRSPIGYKQVSETPDYRPDLDLYIISPEGEIAAFATMWYDTRNQIGILEPVGTVPEFRKLGLGRASNLQLVNQIREQGATKVYVGSTLEFYIRIGFNPRKLYSVWKKTI